MLTSDGQIIRQCLDGNSEAFGLLVDKYKAGVYGFAYSKVRNFHDAEDIAQEAFIKAFKNLHKLKYYDRFHAWICSITINLCKNWIRDNSEHHSSESIEDQDSKVLDILSINQHKEELIFETIHEALESLPEKYYLSITLHYFTGMTSHEIAQFIGTTPTAVRHHISRGKKYLKENAFAGIYGIFQQQLPQADFTFRVLDAVRRAGSNSVPWPKAIPWGFALATGIALLILSLGKRSAVEYPVLNQIAPSSGKMITGDKDISVVLIHIPRGSRASSSQGDREDMIFSSDSEDKEQSSSANKGDKWVQKAEMPTKRYSLSISQVDGKIYAFGGITGGVKYIKEEEKLVPDRKLFNTLEVYDSSTDTWKRRASMPTARAWFSTSVVDGVVYAIGGRLGGSISSPSVRTVEAYNSETDSWTRKAEMPTARYAHSASVVDGMIYVIGGTPDGKGILRTIEVYDPATDTWERELDMPNPRSFFASSVLDGKIYILGGNSDSLANSIISTVEMYDPLENTWEVKASLPVPLTSFSACTLNGNIYAFGGAKAKLAGTDTIPTVWMYDPLLDIWTQKADMPTPRRNLDVCAANGKIYAIGGHYDSYKKGLGAVGTVEEYEPEEPIHFP